MRLFHKLLSFGFAFLGTLESVFTIQNDVTLMPDLLKIYLESVLKFPAPAITEGISFRKLFQWLYFNLHRLELYLKSDYNCEKNPLGSDIENIHFLDIIGQSKKKLRIAAEYFDQEMAKNEDSFKISAVLINHMKAAFKSYTRLWEEINKFEKNSEKSRKISPILPIFGQNITDFCYKRIIIDMIYSVKNNITEPILMEELQKLLNQLDPQSAAIKYTKPI
ncbi:MAG: hypothetical protein LBB12_03510 [Holosporaceae bacterium]|jgi:hypothetical protein|nr:hypothetical protein [Holosporaceae bacterium]